MRGSWRDEGIDKWRVALKTRCKMKCKLALCRGLIIINHGVMVIIIAGSLKVGELK